MILWNFIYPCLKFENEKKRNIVPRGNTECGALPWGIDYITEQVLLRFRNSTETKRRTSPPYMFRQLKTLYNACSVLRQRLVTVLNRVTSSTLNPQRRSRQSAGQHQQLHGGQKAVCIGSERTYSYTARSNGAADGEEPASRFLREPT